MKNILALKSLTYILCLGRTPEKGDSLNHLFLPSHYSPVDYMQEILYAIAVQHKFNIRKYLAKR